MIRQYVKTEILSLKSVNPNWWSSIDNGGLSQCPKGLYMTGNKYQRPPDQSTISNLKSPCQPSFFTPDSSQFKKACLSNMRPWKI